MLRRLASVIAGTFTALFVIGALEQVLPLIYPAIPANLGLNDKKALAEMIASMPMGAFAWLLFGFVAGSFCGGLVAGLVAIKKRKEMALVVGFIVLVGGVLNFAMISHPFWFVVVSLLIYVPLAYMGGSLASRMKDSRTRK
jgi:uncharacterized membrane protein